MSLGHHSEIPLVRHKITDEHKQELRKERIRRQTERIIKDDIERDKRCCLDKGDVPAYFVRCVNCPSELDTGEDLC